MQQIATPAVRGVGARPVSVFRGAHLTVPLLSARASKVHKQLLTARFHVCSAAADTASASTSAASGGAMANEWMQKEVELPPYKRGCHIITRKLVDDLPELREYEVGLANFFILHTSASLTINENASPDVPKDLNDALDKLAPEGPHYRHDEEGSDDMPAHIKSSLMGPSLTVPIRFGKLGLGIWQGIYLNEHRNYGGARRIIVTVQGKKRGDGKAYSQW